MTSHPIIDALGGSAFMKATRANVRTSEPHFIELGLSSRQTIDGINRVRISLSDPRRWIDVFDMSFVHAHGINERDVAYITSLHQSDLAEAFALYTGLGLQAARR